ncbi:unnamed protein product, partial [Polarella glacialis]
EQLGRCLSPPRASINRSPSPVQARSRSPSPLTTPAPSSSFYGRRVTSISSAVAGLPTVSAWPGGTRVVRPTSPTRCVQTSPSPRSRRTYQRPWLNNVRRTDAPPREVPLSSSPKRSPSPKREELVEQRAGIVFFQDRFAVPPPKVFSARGASPRRGASPPISS